MKKRSIRLLLSALLVLVMAFQSFAAPLSYAGPTAASEPAKITGTWSMDASGSWHFNAPDGAAKDGWYYLNTTNNATDYNWFCFDANGVMRTGWVPDKNDPSVWYYTGESKDSSEGGLVKGWITDPQDGKKYYLDPATGVMCHGWKQIDGVWYYFTESRYADRKWAPDTKGYWMDKATGRHSHGSLYVNERTPDGYYVGANGAWVQNHSEDDNSDKPDPAPETKALSEILPTDFPTSADSAWVNADGQKAYKDGDNIKVGNLTLGKDTTATKSGDNYVCKSGDATVTFNVKNGAAESITVTGSSDSNGTYTAPETKKLSEILPSGFPTSADSAWVNGNSQKAYKDGDNIKVGNLTLGKDTTATKSGDNYVCKLGDATVTFNVKDGVAESITVTGSTDSNGTYAPAAPLVSVTSVLLDKAELSITVGDPDVELTATVLPDNATNKAVTWTSNNTNVATVDDEGNVHAVAAGNATITVTTVDGGKTNTCTVTVTAPAPAKYTVTFDLNGITGTAAPTAQTIEKDGKVTKPADPTDSVHTFADWYKTKDATTGALSDQWDFDNGTVTADMTLYAQWERTMESILNTNSGVPKVTDLTPPSNAWENSTSPDCKAFVGIDKDGDTLFVVKNEGQDVQPFGLLMDDTFVRINENTYKYNEDDVTVIANMTDGKFTSCKWKFIRSDYQFLNGTYVPEGTTFKAVYDTTGGTNTLTFYYDSKDHSGEGTVYENGTTNYLFDNSKSNGAKWGYNGNRSYIKSVVIDASVAGYKGLTSTAFMFQGMTTATNISGAEYLDVSNVTDMSYMFNNFGGGSSSNPTTLNVVPDVSKWNTGNVKNMCAMFESYGNFSSSLDKVPDVSNWNTGNVTDMSFMFQKYGHESQNFNAVPDVSKWNTGNVKNMAYMFKEYGDNSTALGTVPNVSEWNTAKVTNMSSMFGSYGSASKVLDKVPNVSNWKTDNVTNMSSMFSYYGVKDTGTDTIPGSKVLDEVPNVASWNTAKVTNMSNMFKGYGRASTVLNKVPDVSNWITTEVTNMSNMFNDYGHTSDNIDCTLVLSGWDLSKITGTYGDNVFTFTPKTFNVMIPAKTGKKSNEGDKWYYGNGTNHIAPPTGKIFTLPDSKNLMRSASGGQTHDAPMAETEVSEPTAEVFEPEFEPEKFEEAKPEELIEPAEAVAEEAAS